MIRAFQASRGRGPGRTLFLFLPLLGALVSGCAREATPPGGPPDRLPPIVILSEPDTFSTVEPFRSPVTLRFSERISERPSSGTLDQSVVVSPSSGEVRVSHGREGLTVRALGGFEAGHIYRVTVLPVIQDMFGNALQEPFELFFSTGPEFTPNVVAGSVIDRLTGEPLRDARVDAAVAESDVVHTAVTDSAGIFALRYLPAGDYVVSAYLDRNRNAQPDFTEPQGTRPAPLNGGGEAADTTIVLEVALLARDTTSARLARVIVEDSISLGVSLDDYLDPELPLDDVRVVVTSDSVDAPGALAVLHQHEADAYRSALADSLAREQAVRDSVAQAQADSAARAEAAAGDTTAAVDPGDARGPAETEPDPPPVQAEQDASEAGEAEERPTAQQTFIVILDGVLAPDVPYEVEISNITNINGVGGGGGTVGFTRPAPPPPPPEDTTQAEADSVATDTIPAPPGDTLTVPADSAVRDTIPAAAGVPGEAAPGDTPAVPADSTARDTIPPPPADSARRDTIASQAADSVRRDTVSARSGDSLRRGTVAILPATDLVRRGRRARVSPARKRSSRSSPSGTVR
ncbi:MAG: carboxypeptidase regulatory-like domain-containing protein [Gammaproteobacteria bacterium]|nr:carboxypeptidase regulatory-like domain-containing protein [Gammaproteobacteria bacterium]MDE0650083.1 carboxypeptidase regulatory-like domain-containing protein [Gammaproteobacteria bacterium]